MRRLHLVGSDTSGRAPRPPAEDEFAALEGMARVLTSSGWFRVVRRFRPRLRYAADDGAPKLKALFVDVETTGRDHETDAIIELAAVPFEYGADGQIYGVGEAVVCLEDPRRRIPDEVVELTGITNEMVHGKRLDEARVAEVLGGATLVVAHNAAFDRRFVERRIPAFVRVPWACSQTEIPWQRHGCRGTKLDYILMTTGGEFFDGHRAADDCYAGIHVLASPTPAGTLPFAALLRSSRTPTVRVWALEAAYDRKEALKARGYRWCDGQKGKPRAWYIDAPAPRAGAECAWLAHHVYAERAPAYRMEAYSALERFSARI